MAHPEPVLIAGGGIAGLATALALAEAIDSLPHSRAAPAALGSRCRHPDRAQRCPRAGRARGRGTPCASCRPAERNRCPSRRKRRILARMPLGDWIEARHGAPYWVAPSSRPSGGPPCRRRRRAVDRDGHRLGCRSVEPRMGTARGAPRERRHVRGPLLVGADGIRSSVRTTVAPGANLTSPAPPPRERCCRPTRHRRTVAQTAGVWLAPDAHVVHYPVAAGAQIAVVAIVPDDRRVDDWAAPNDWAALVPHLAAFSPVLTDVLAAAPEWRRWALFESEPLARLVTDRIALVGDAAHPVLPFLAQGGVMALEDAVVLAHCLARQPNDAADALKSYEAARRARVAAIAAASRRNGRIFHLVRPRCTRAQPRPRRRSGDAPHGQLRLGLRLAGRRNSGPRSERTLAALAIHRRLVLAGERARGGVRHLARECDRLRLGQGVDDAGLGRSRVCRRGG